MGVLSGDIDLKPVIQQKESQNRNFMNRWINTIELFQRCTADPCHQVQHQGIEF